MFIVKRSPFTGKSRTMCIPVTQKQIDDWKGGMLIQNAMPNLLPQQREFIKTGITSKEWSDMFGDK